VAGNSSADFFEFLPSLRSVRSKILNRDFELLFLVSPSYLLGFFHLSFFFFFFSTRLCLFPLSLAFVSDRPRWVTAQRVYILLLARVDEPSSLVVRLFDSKIAFVFSFLSLWSSLRRSQNSEVAPVFLSCFAAPALLSFPLSSFFDLSTGFLFFFFPTLLVDLPISSANYLTVLLSAPGCRVSLVRLRVSHVIYLPQFFFLGPFFFCAHFFLLSRNPFEKPGWNGRFFFFVKCSHVGRFYAHLSLIHD